MKRKLTAEEERQISDYLEICAKLCQHPIVHKSDVRQVLSDFVFQGPIESCELDERTLNIKVKWLARQDGDEWTLVGHSPITIYVDTILHMIPDRDGSALMVVSSNHSVETIPSGQGRLDPAQVKGLNA